MTPEIAKKWLPIIQAVAEGKTLQVRVTVPDIPGAYDWFDLKGGDGLLSPPVIHNPDEYRIKPEPMEFWVISNVDGDRERFSLHTTIADAQSYKMYETERIIHVREVIDE